MTDALRAPRRLGLARPPPDPDEAPTSAHDRLRSAFHAHHAMVYATAHRILADPHEAEDVTQMVFEKVAKHFQAIRDAERLGSYLKSCAVRECLVLLRRRRWWSSWRGAKALAPISETTDSTEAFVVTAVRELLAPLSAQERTAVVLKLVEGHSHEEVATLMGISVATARRRLASARRRMQHRASDDIQRRLVDDLEASS